jgi:hypothetical protein
MRYVLCVVVAFAASMRGALPAVAADVPRVEQLAVHEVTLQATGKYENPYTEVWATADLTGPSKTWIHEVPLFWDGGQAWKLRVAPFKPGAWEWEIRSNDPGLRGKSGSFEIVASKRRGSIRAMDGFESHFERQDRSPFWFLGDTAWGLFTDNAMEKHDRAAALAYLDARAAQGVNVVHSMLLSEAGWGNQGGPPWADISAEKINPGYWQEVDLRLAHANSRGIVCGLALAWGDKRKQEPYAWRKFPSLEARKRYARYIAGRYSAYDVYFIVSGEWHGEVRTRPSTEEEVRAEFIEIGDELAKWNLHGRMIGIHPMTAHGSVREFNAADWMSFGDYQQNYRDLHGRVLESRKTNKPVVNSEYGYFLRDQSGDGVPDKDNSTSAAAMRHATWDIVMAGGYPVTGFGTTYFGGNRDPGPFDLHAAKNKPWEEHYGRVKSIFEGLEWWKLEPHDEVLTCATACGKEGKEFNHVVPPAATYWCLAEPGKVYLVYLRGLKEALQVKFEGVRGGYEATRIDPRSGERVNLAAPSGNEYVVQPPDEQDWLVLLRAQAGAGAKTQVSLEGGRWLINGKLTNPGSAAEGLLMNVRMVNATFEDRNPATRPAGFDADANTEEFVAKIAEYAAQGVNAFTLCLQGGMPGYEGAVNSAFESDGSLRADYLRRMERVIEACDEQDVAVILGCYYQRQSKILKDEAALKAGLTNVARWIQEKGWKHVLVEVANEYPHGGFAHLVIREPKGQAGLLRYFKEAAPGVLVTASGYGRGKIDAEVAEACDFLTPHWNGTRVEDIPQRLETLKRFGKPIVVNEDDKTGAQAVAALEATVAGGAGYGLMLKDHNQTTPFRFDGAADDPVFYAALKRATSLRQDNP